MFNDWLLSQLRERNWSQADLARASGITTGGISNYINGRTPDEAALRKIAKALRLPAEFVFEKAGILPPKTDLTPKKRELMERIKENDVDDDIAQFVIEMLDVAVRNKQRQVPANINPKTTPR